MNQIDRSINNPASHEIWLTLRWVVQYTHKSLLKLWRAHGFVHLQCLQSYSSLSKEVGESVPVLVSCEVEELHWLLFDIGEHERGKGDSVARGLTPNVYVNLEGKQAEGVLQCSRCSLTNNIKRDL